VNFVCYAYGATGSPLIRVASGLTVTSTQLQPSFNALCGDELVRDNVPA